MISCYIAILKKNRVKFIYIIHDLELRFFFLGEGILLLNHQFGGVTANRPVGRSNLPK